MERMAICPSCGKPTRVTEDELIHKRGVCLLCETAFTVSPSDLLDDAPPYRESPAPLVVATAAPLDLPGVREDPAQSKLELRARGSSLWTPGLLALLVVGLVAFAAVETRMWWMLLLEAALIPITYSIFARRESLKIEGDTLIITRRLGVDRSETIALRDIGDVHVVENLHVEEGRIMRSHALRIDVKDGRTLAIGRWMGLDEMTMTQVGAWLASRLGWATKRLRDS